jgi:hypothetical protein
MKDKILILYLALILMFGCKKESNEPIKVTLSTKTFQLNNVDNIFFTNDNGLLISGRSNDKYSLIKIDCNLNTEWTKNNYDWGNLIFGSGWGSSFYSVQVVKVFQLNDGKYVCVGSITEGGDVVYSSALIVVLTQNGTQIQKFVFDDIAVSNALQTGDGGYILFGFKIIKLDRNFNQLWSKNIYDNKYLPSQIVLTSNGGFAITGSYDGEQIFLKKYDSNGNELLSQTYKHNEYPFEESGFDLTQLIDDGFLIIGRTGRTFVPNIVDCQMIRTSSNGDTIWTKRFGYSTNSWLDRIISYNQNEIVIKGSIGFPNENQKSTMIKINANGQILDSVTVNKFEMMVHSPLDYYIKVISNDSAHTDLSMIYVNNLFDKK